MSRTRPDRWQARHHDLTITKELGGYLVTHNGKPGPMKAPNLFSAKKLAAVAAGAEPGEIEWLT